MLNVIGKFWEKFEFRGVFGIKITLDDRPKNASNWRGGAFVHLFGSKSHSIIGKKVETMLDIIVASWEKNRPVLSICGTFYDQNHNWLSAKKVEKMLDIIGAFWEKNSFESGGGGLEPLWHLLGTKISLDYRPTKSK